MVGKVIKKAALAAKKAAKGRKPPFKKRVSKALKYMVEG